MAPGGEGQIGIIAHFARTGEQMPDEYAQHDVIRVSWGLWSRTGDPVTTDVRLVSS